MQIDLKLEGVDAILENLRKMETRIVNKAIKEALMLAAEPIAESARNATTFTDRTGKLRKAIKVGEVSTKGGVKYIPIGIQKSDNSEVFYGKFLEYGTSKMSARPFMGPAYLANKDEAMRIIKSTLRRYL